MATYVMSDLHGQYDMFIKMIEKIKFNEQDNMYILGDVIDRGPAGIKIIDYIRSSENIHLLRGNHEQMLVEYFMTDIEYESWADAPWFENGGYTTYLELKEKGAEYLCDLIKYILKLPTYKIIDNYFLVHAGLNTNKEITSLEEAIKNSSEETLLWCRDFIINDHKIEGYTVICGHTQTRTFGSDKIIKFKNNILIDCGCASGADPGCLRLDDMEEFYI